MNKNEKKNALDKALNSLKAMVFANSKGKAKSIKTKIKYKFEIVEDTEGQTIHYPALEVGAPVTVGDSEGGEVATDGHYQIDENTSITVKDGVIESIETAEVAEDMEDENVSEVSDEVAEQVIEVIEQVQEQVAELVAEVEAVTAVVEEFKKMDKNVKALTDAVAKFSKEPVTASVTKTEGFKDKTAELADFLASKRKNK